MIEKIIIGDTDILLEDTAPEKGKIIVANPYGNNYSYYWGAMGGDLKSFLCDITPSYFADKLMGANDNNEMDVPATFAEVRKFIRKEIGLPWYEHQAFQKQMREVLNEYQKDCEEEPSERHFVYRWEAGFIGRLDFYLIEDHGQLERQFKDIPEIWNFIQKRPNAKYNWLVEMHGKLVKYLAASTKKAA